MKKKQRQDARIFCAEGGKVMLVEKLGEVTMLYVDVPGCAETGKAAMAWLAARPEIDNGRIGVTGSSFGSFFSAIMMAEEPRHLLRPGHPQEEEPGAVLQELRKLVAEFSATFIQCGKCDGRASAGGNAEEAGSLLPDT